MGLNKVVDFYTAKLLKEKGFELENQWSEDYKYNFYAIKDFDNDWRDSFDKRVTGELLDGVYLSPLSVLNEDVAIIAPTIAEVVMWLYEKYEIWISVEPPFPKRIVLWEYYIQKSEDRSLLGQNSGYSSPTEAYEAAIEYCLTNLI